MASLQCKKKNLIDYLTIDEIQKIDKEIDFNNLTYYFKVEILLQ